MTRPQIIRADSIDLQDQDTPSAKEHKQSPTTNTGNNGQPVANHQAETLREVAAETKEDRRSSWANADIGDLQQYAEDLAHGADGSMSQNGDKTQQDGVAVAPNGGASDDGDVDGDDDLDDDMMDKISSSPSIEDEDIDFEFVYALHTFVATVEGQANATKGDTMVLLDDSNSYWWLVRVVKDSSIGYLPAEHIETPTERLARLNKHRNIDLSSTMLSDQAEKTKNPIIKTAIRRTKKKSVAFAAPTYVDYSDIDYSTDEEDAEAELAAQKQATLQQQAASQRLVADEAGVDESAKVEPLKPRGQQKQVKLLEPVDIKENRDERGASSDTVRDSDEFFENSRTTRNGTVRNTDSFFKDETVETKKITLTPNLLRDDNEPRLSNDSKEIRQRPSFDKLEKELVAEKSKDKKKDKDKKEKEKKPSAIRSFFSRKDKKKSADDDEESLGGKRSLSLDVSADGADDETQAADVESSPEKGPSTPQRNPINKLHRQQPRIEPSPTRKPGGAMQQSGMDISQFLVSDGKPNNVASVPPTSSVRMVESEPLESPEKSPTKEAKSSKSTVSESKPPKVSKAKSRVELDDFDSLEEEEEAPAEPSRPAAAPAPVPEPKREPSEDKQMRPTLPGSYPDSYLSSTSQQTDAQTANLPQPMERLSESPVEVSPITPSNPPALTGDTSSQEDRSSPVSSPSPELVEHEGRGHQAQDSVMTSSSTNTTSTWNDTNLRAFFDSGSVIRDLLVVVYDKTDVPPAGPDHPVASTLFREQNAKLAEITTQLDNMLGDWLARKQRLRGAV